MSVPPYLSRALSYLDDWFTYQKLHDLQTPGYSIAISYAGEVLYKKGFGFANAERQEEMTPEHLFRIASHSKTFTATAIMMLMDEKSLSIHDPASSYLPFLLENPDTRMQQVTIAQLLSHSAGIARDGEDASFWRLQRPFPDRSEIEAYFKSAPLSIEYNTRFKYSNFAYALLGLIIERVSELSYREFMEQRILRPLELSGIGAEYDPTAAPYITGYTGLAPNNKRAAISPAIETNDIIGATGFYSTAENLCTFYSAVMPGSGKLLSDSLKREMLRQQWEVEDEVQPRGYSLGFMCKRLGDRKLRGHTGGMPGNVSRTLFDPEEGIVVSILSNSHMTDPYRLQKGAWHVLDFFKENHSDKIKYQQFEGLFYDLWGALRFASLGDTLYKTDPGAALPFESCGELAFKEGTTFSIVKDSGYNSYGQDAVFKLEGEKLSGLNYGGYPKFTNEQYNTLIEELQLKFDESER